MSPVSTKHSLLIYDALKECGVTLVSALPETWLVHLIRQAEDDPEMTLVRLAKEEEGVGSTIRLMWARASPKRKPWRSHRTSPST